MPNETQTPDQTQEPGQGQQGNGTTEVDIEKMQSRLANLTTKLSETETELQSKTREAQGHQKKRDSLQARVDRMNLKRPAQKPLAQARTPAKGVAGVQPAPAQTGGDDLVQFANEQAREAMLYREVLARGLSLDDVEGLEFETPAELGIQLTIITQQKEIEGLKVQYEQSVNASQSPGVGGGGGDDSVKVDTGGVSVTEAQQQLQNDLSALDEQAGELRGSGRHKEATWVTLQRLHGDPSKIVSNAQRSLS